jgi:hypothetical protein
VTRGPEWKATRGLSAWPRWRPNLVECWPPDFITHAVGQVVSGGLCWWSSDLALGGCHGGWYWWLPYHPPSLVQAASRSSHDDGDTFNWSSTGRFGSSLDGGAMLGRYFSACIDVGFFGGCAVPPWCDGVGNLHSGGCGGHCKSTMVATLFSRGGSTWRD